MNEEQDLTDIYNRCLDLVSKNKLNTSNAWDLPFIDHIDEYSFDNAQFSHIAATVDTATFIYSKKVDSLHESSFRFAGSLVAPTEDQQKPAKDGSKSQKRRARKGTSSILAPEKHKTITISNTDLALSRMQNDPIMPFVFRSVVSDIPDLLTQKAHFSPDGYPIILPDTQLTPLPYIAPTKMFYRAPVLPEQLSIGFKHFKAALNNDEVEPEEEIREEALTGDINKYIEDGMDEIADMGDVFAELSIEMDDLPGLEDDGVYIEEQENSPEDEAMGEFRRIAYMNIKPINTIKKTSPPKPKAPKRLLDFTKITDGPKVLKTSSKLSSKTIDKYAQARTLEVLSPHPDLNLEKLFTPPVKLMSSSSMTLQAPEEDVAELEVAFDDFDVDLGRDDMDTPFRSPVGKLKPFIDSDTLALFKPVVHEQQIVGDGTKVAKNRTMVNMPRLKNSVKDVIDKEEPKTIVEVISRLPEHHEFNDLKAVTVPYAIIALLHLASEGGCDIDTETLQIIPK